MYFLFGYDLLLFRDYNMLPETELHGVSRSSIGSSQAGRWRRLGVATRRGLYGSASGVREVTADRPLEV